MKKIVDGIIEEKKKSDVAFLSSFIDAEFVITNGSEISHETILKSFIVLFVGMIVVTSCLICLCIFEPNIDLLDLLFESISAFATVGLSTGITPELSTISKIVIMITMFIGRVGGLTLLSLWTKKGKKYVSYPTEDILIG